MPSDPALQLLDFVGSLGSSGEPDPSKTTWPGRKCSDVLGGHNPSTGDRQVNLERDW